MTLTLNQESGSFLFYSRLHFFLQSSDS